MHIMNKIPPFIGVLFLVACALQEPVEQVKPTEPLVAEEEPMEQSDEEQITEAFKRKYPDREVAALQIATRTADHARGMVSFGTQPGDQGMFVAAHLYGQWQIVYDGNGAFNCDAGRRYAVPEELMEGCIDE